MCISICITVPSEAEEVIRFPGTRVVSSCEPPTWVMGIVLESSARAISDLNP